MANLKEVTAYLRGEIPITAAMGIAAVRLGREDLYGASAAARRIGIMRIRRLGDRYRRWDFAGFSLLYLLLKDEGISSRILIQKSATDYLRMIDCDMTATATLPSDEAREEFLATMKRKRRARMEVQSKVLANTLVAATHTGLFVAMIY